MVTAELPQPTRGSSTPGQDKLSRGAQPGATLGRVNRLRTPLVTALLALPLALAVAGGCKARNSKGSLAELTPPKHAPAWESRFAVAFDNSYTPTAVHLQGRAPNDVLDQQLFQARLGHAAIVVLVRVGQVWGKGRYQGRQDQFLELEFGEVLLGSLPKAAPERLMVQVKSADDLPGSLNGEVMLLFLRWDTETDPPFHHHLMPADGELIALIQAMVKHAQVEGVIDNKGDEKKPGKRGRKGRKGRKSKNGGADAAPTTPEPDGATPLGGQPVEPGGFSADQPPPPRGPEPDASTGLDQLGEPDPEPDPEPGPEPDPAAANGA